MIALGVGFNSRCREAELEALVAAALDEVDDGGGGLLATALWKRATGLIEPVAARLGLTPVYLDRETLRAQQAAVLTGSRAALAATGLHSVAEAAALAAAGPRARLVLPRRVHGDATCAAAVPQQPRTGTTSTPPTGGKEA